MAEKDDLFKSDGNINLGEEVASIDREHNGLIDQSGNVRVLGHDLNSLPLLVQFMRRVLESEDVPFQIYTNPQGRKKVVKVSSLAEDFYRIHAMTTTYSRDYTYHPMLALFWEVFRKHRIRQCSLKKSSQVFGDGELEVEVFNQFVDTLRKEARRRKLKKKAADWENATDDNVARTSRYMDAMFDKTESVYVVDLYLHHKASWFEPKSLASIEDQVKRQSLFDFAYIYGDDAELKDLLDARRRFDTTLLNEDRKRLFANLRRKPSLFAGLIGYVWRIEWSRICGHYLHVTFFFSEISVPDRALFPNFVGRYWREEVTRGRGVVRHGFSMPFGDQPGVGCVSRDDVKARELLKQTMCYRANRNRYVYVQPVPKCRLFGTGQMRVEKPAASVALKKAK